MKKALVVGGRTRFILDTIKPKLAMHGVEILEHWDMDHRTQASRAIPAGAELVILFKDMHGQATALGQSLGPQAKKLGIPYVSTTRQAAHFRADLLRYGFEQVMHAAPQVEVPLPVAAPVEAASVALPTWVMQALKAGTPISLTPEHETALFNVGSERMFTVLVRVTPADAARWLEARVRAQRPVAQRHVEELASAFRRGEYHFTHQGIAFSKDGSNQDGQHRLWAIFNSGVTVDINVTFGQEAEAMRVIDSKIRPRAVWQNRQILTGDTQSKKRLEAALIIRLLVYPDLRHAPSFDESEDLIATYRDGLDWALTLQNKKIYGTAPVRGSLAFAYRTAPGMVEAFAEQVLHGENLQRGMPAFAARTALEVAVGRSNRREVALKVLRACQGHLQSENMPRVMLSEECVTFFGKVHGIKGVTP
ncbi:MAG: hypothetical protein KKD89_07135 [Candidatus Omnitrophica bacterium]|nr:hypothetical protein [Candidatus Omnitrophota bacterium]